MQSRTFDTLHRWLDTKPFVRQPLALRRWIRRLKLTGTEYAVFDLVYERAHFQPDCAIKLTIREIARELCVDTSTVTRAVKDLRSRGLIDKKRITGGAVTYLTLTEDMRWYVELSPDRQSRADNPNPPVPKKRARCKKSNQRHSPKQEQTDFGFDAALQEAPSPEPGRKPEQNAETSQPRQTIDTQSSQSPGRIDGSVREPQQAACSYGATPKSPSPKAGHASETSQPRRSIDAQSRQSRDRINGSSRPEPAQTQAQSAGTKRKGALFRSLLQSGKSQGIDAQDWLKRLEREAAQDQAWRLGERQPVKPDRYSSVGIKRGHGQPSPETDKPISSADVERMIRHHGNNTRRPIEALVPEVLYSIHEGAQSHLPRVRALRAAGAMIARGAWSTPYGYYDSHYCSSAYANLHIPYIYKEPMYE